MQSLWMLFATFTFAAMAVCVKLASDLYSVSEIVMYRGAIGAAFMLLLIRYQRESIKTPLVWDHLWRCVVGVASLWLWFLSLKLLPLATSMTLNYMSPIWIAAILFAARWRSGNRRFDWGLVTAIVMSFIGVTLLLRPSIHQDQWVGGMVGLSSGILSALAYLQVRRLGQLGEPEHRVVFYFSLTGLIVGLLGCLAPLLQGDSPGFTTVHTGRGVLLLATIGVTAAAAQMAMTRAYRLGNTLVTANLQYTGIVFSSAWGVLIWGDLMGWMSWTGIAIILLSGIVATFYNIRNTASSKNVPAADPIATEI